MILYHATNKENKEKILQEGFKVSKGSWKDNQWIGRYFVDNVFGEGVYLTNIENNTRDYGNKIIKCEVDDEHLGEKFIILNDRNTPKAIEVIKKTSKRELYRAISVYFKDYNYTEVIVYEPSIIKILGEE
ncbi:hypothetical protein [Clostridium gasigenes]|uniref:Uncharacterized protein n=1 Tax=Clostridium gasigenes TaxID=94869 RepID=A0A7X0VQE1_9CLOT|nr:hypothetical protein [Clostridium gasigenes]MBB6713898.1 hypothetical protein [Clostridium gasigenes]